MPDQLNSQSYSNKGRSQKSTVQNSHTSISQAQSQNDFIEVDSIPDNSAPPVQHFDGSQVMGGQQKRRRGGDNGDLDDVDDLGEDGDPEGRRVKADSFAVDPEVHQLNVGLEEIGDIQPAQQPAKKKKKKKKKKPQAAQL